MKTIIVTGPIGAGKSYVSLMLKEYGIPVYDCDSAVKEIYSGNGELAAMVTEDIFSNPEKLERLENALFPVLMEDFLGWAEASGKEFVAFESATILQKKFFDGFGDYVLLVYAPEELRISRAMSRGGISMKSLAERMALQVDQRRNPRVSFILDNSGDGKIVREQLEKFLNGINYVKRKN